MTASSDRIWSRVTATRHALIQAGPDGDLPPLPKTAWLEIDLDALVANVRLLQGLLPLGVRIEPVIKADAYGHGSVWVARALVAAGIRSLGVATFDEALELRQAGIEVPIAIHFPIPPELAPDALRHRMTITAGDGPLLGRTLAAFRWHQLAPRSRAGTGSPSSSRSKPAWAVAASTPMRWLRRRPRSGPIHERASSACGRTSRPLATPRSPPARRLVSESPPASWKRLA